MLVGKNLEKMVDLFIGEVADYDLSEYKGDLYALSSFLLVGCMAYFMDSKT